MPSHTDTNRFIRVKADDPNRCRASAKNGQCPFRAVGTFDIVKQIWEGPKCCPRHAAGAAAKSIQRKDTRMYNIGRWQSQLEQMVDHPKLKSNREEIGILRVLMQDTLNKCTDGTELVLQSGKLIELCNQITNAVKVCNSVELNLGQILDRTQAIAFIGAISEVISTYIQDPDILEALAEDLMGTLEKFLPSDPNAPQIEPVKQLG